uniref:ARAD1C35090p n=1 Tax=Blastobotrys adeninivorans TaxID=409370 RepID=A0A060T376_BLAAD
MSSSSQAYQREEQNDNRLKELSSKISALRSVTSDIHDYASEHSLIDQTTETMSSMLTSVKTTAMHLTRSATAGHSTFRMVGLALLAFFIIYTLFRFL